ncbi:MAG: WbqC family protein [Bacteroidetes bacterium]|nr:WbqC family protein [Bacteroidota bacterium]
MGHLLLSTAYLPPLAYFGALVSHGCIIIEKHENFIKQTYRNRCIIAGPNGLQTLTVPVLRGSFHKVGIGELEIDYSRRWIPVHSGAISAAYRNAPYYHFYANDLIDIISERHNLLIELNTKLLVYILDILKIKTAICYTGSFVHPDNNPDDMRYLFSPKRAEKFPASMSFTPYIQVFHERHGFLPDLSIIDLLFNLGPDAASYLKTVVQVWP